jgi:hypothetical protein
LKFGRKNWAKSFPQANCTRAFERVIVTFFM